MMCNVHQDIYMTYDSMCNKIYTFWLTLVEQFISTGIWPLKRVEFFNDNISSFFLFLISKYWYLDYTKQKLWRSNTFRGKSVILTKKCIFARFAESWCYAKVLRIAIRKKINQLYELKKNTWNHKTHMIPTWDSQVR